MVELNSGYDSFNFHWIVPLSNAGPSLAELVKVVTAGFCWERCNDAISVVLVISRSVSSLHRLVTSKQASKLAKQLTNSLDQN